jgi:hypothetical protein
MHTSKSVFLSCALVVTGCGHSASQAEGSTLLGLWQFPQRAVRNGAIDPGEVRDKYARRYVPGQRLYLDQARPSERADIVLSNEDLERPKLKFRDPRMA